MKALRAFIRSRFFRYSAASFSGSSGKIFSMSASTRPGILFLPCRAIAAWCPRFHHLICRADRSQDRKPEGPRFLGLLERTCRGR